MSFFPPLSFDSSLFGGVRKGEPLENIWLKRDGSLDPGAGIELGATLTGSFN